tara:strand:- start:1257 stop:1676 length:420 start_codon:yes stop_codon:yes gene_type:complete
MALQILATIAAFIASQGTRKAVQKYGAQAVDKAKKLIQATKTKKPTSSAKTMRDRRKKIKKDGLSGEEVRDITIASGLLGASGSANYVQNQNFNAKMRRKKEEEKRKKNEKKMKMGGAVTMKNKCDGAAIKGKTRARIF